MLIGFPKVGFANPWWFVRELQGVRELVHGMPKSVQYTINELIQRKILIKLKVLANECYRFIQM